MKKNLQRLMPKFKHINSLFGQNTFTLLDVGAGNHSASKTKSLFPNCIYHGVDLNRHANNDDSDFEVMEAFYEMDLTKLDFKVIPDNHFDFIRMTHIIEHLHNGDEVIEQLIPKMKKGGHIYIEYPGQKSTTLPSMHGTLNFYDDSTHVRIYSVPEVAGLLSKHNFEILSKGTRRNAFLLSIMPLKVAGSIFSKEKLKGDTFWDLLGFAEFVFARKN